MQYKRLESVDLIDLVEGLEDVKLIRKLAKLMLEMDYATSQREDAYEILKRRKMDGQQVLYRLDNLEEFTKILRQEIRRIRVEVKEMMKECS